MNLRHHEPCMPIHPANLPAQGDSLAPLRRSDRARDHASCEAGAWLQGEIAQESWQEAHQQRVGGVLVLLQGVIGRIHPSATAPAGRQGDGA